MAAATTRRTAKKATAAKAKPAPTPEVEEEELEELETETDEADGDTEDDELEELEEDEVEETKPTTKKSAGRDAGITFGIQQLVALIKTETGDDTNPRAVRTLIRKMARDESGRVDREIKAGNRERYNWTGPNDAEVVAIVAAYKGGELEEEKKAKLDALKQSKAAKAAAAKAEAGDAPVKKTAKKTTKKAAAKPAPVEEVEDDEELDFEEDE